MSVKLNFEFDKIIRILEQAPEAKLSEELQKNHLSTKIVLKELTRVLRAGNHSLSPSLLGKTLSLITPAQATKAWAGDFATGIFDNVSNKSEFLEIMRKCIVLNERVATTFLKYAWGGASRLYKIDPSDLKQLRDITAAQSASTERLLAAIFLIVISLIQKQEEDSAINFINHFPEFAKPDAKDDEGTPLVLLAISENCSRVVDRLLEINKGNSCAEDRFGANVVDYAIAYDMDYLLSEINSIPVSEIKESKWLAHVWNLAGSRNLGNVSAEYERFYGDDITRIARSALCYLNHWKYKKYTPSGESENSHPLNKMNKDILERTLLRLYKKEKFDGLNIPEKPIILKQRWFEHAAYVVFGRGGRVMKCNRGEDCEVSGVRIYEMPQWNSNALPGTFESIERTDKFMNCPEFHKWLLLSHTKDIKQKEQPIKNCSSESGKAAINALFIDEALETFPDEDVALKEAKFVYKDYTVFMRMRALKDYLEQSRNYDISLLTRIKEKVADLEKRKTLWAGQTVKLLHLFKKYNVSC